MQISSIIKTENDTPAPPGPTPAAKLRKQIMIGFMAAVTAGLAMAVWYVGGRILAAKETRPVTRPSTRAVVTAPKQPAPAPMVQSPASEPAKPPAREPAKPP